MSFGGGGGGTQTQTSETRLPEWVDAASHDNYNLALGVSNKLAQPYAGNRVAGMPAAQTGNINALQNNVGSGQPTYDTAMGMVNGLAGFNSGQINAQMIRNTDLSPYMNPYTQSVIDPTMTLMEQSRQQALNQVGSQAGQAHAFGGSRQGITEGVTNAQSELEKGRFAADLYGKDFAQAQAAATGDITRDISTQQANMGARQYDATFQSNLANQMTGLADKGQTNFLTGLQAAMSGQDMHRQLEQQKLDAAMALYNEKKQRPLDQLAIRQNALSNSPYGQTVQTTKPGPSEDIGGKILGGASTVVGMAGSIAAIMA